MKRIMTWVVCLLSLSFPLQAGEALQFYASQSVMANGTFVKIRVTETGIYKLTYETLQAMGIRPEEARVFGYGGALQSRDFVGKHIDDLPEVPVYVHKGIDNRFGPGDYLLFHAQGPVAWEYRVASRSYQHTTNTYAQHGYYFVASGVGKGLNLNEMVIEPLSATKAYEVADFLDYQVYEKELLNIQDADNGVIGGGNLFLGEEFVRGKNTSLTVPFNFPNKVSGSSVKLRIAVASNSTSMSTTFDLSVGEFDTAFVNKKKGDSFLTKGVYETYTASFQTQSVRQDVVMDVKVPADGKAWLDFIELHAERHLIMTGSVLYFRNIKYLGSKVNSLYKISNASRHLQVWNITRADSIYRMPTEWTDNQLTFVGTNQTPQQFVAVDVSSSTFATPEVVGKVHSQDLHGLNDIEYVIITPFAFKVDAERLAQAHRDIDGLTVAVVTDQEVYNEFSSGTPDATAYRRFMKMFYDRWATGEASLAPQYLLLMGDGTFDNRKLLPNSGPNTLLTYQSSRKPMEEVYAYPTDDYFGLLEDGTFSELEMRLNIGIGRFPVSNANQAASLVDKTIAYMDNMSKGNWKNQLCFLGDDGGSNEGIIHMASANLIADTIKANFPNFQVNKILLDSYVQEVSASGESYPMAKNKFDNLIRNGVLYFNYMGHGSANGITNENMLTRQSIEDMTNRNLGVWGLGTCSFSHYDTRDLSAAEMAVLNPNGGALGVFSAARTVFAPDNEKLLLRFSLHLFRKTDGKYPRIGDAVRLAKNDLSPDSNRMSYCYLGDPAVRLAYPDPYLVNTLSLSDIAMEQDTLRALSIHTLQGRIATKEGTPVSDFNGRASIVLYDKEQQFITLDNHGDINGGYRFNDRISVLYKGETCVQDGQFELTFMLPKDIQYNYGTGRISYYAYDTITGLEAQGYDEAFIIGGSDPNATFETEGPEVAIYLNTPYFVSGGKTDERPLFIAYLRDQNGINTSGSGIGHDLQLIVDNKTDQTWVLNDVFVTDNGNFRQGSVRYKMAELEEGKHSLLFRAWDLLNNSTTKTLDFEVVKGHAPEIYVLTVYPNPVPVDGEVHFVIQHDRPEAILDVTVNIFDVSGRKVHSFSRQGTEEITFSPRQAFVSAGIYLYQLNIRTKDSNYATKTRKIIVLGQ